MRRSRTPVAHVAGGQFESLEDRAGLQALGQGQRGGTNAGQELLPQPRPPPRGRLITRSRRGQDEPEPGLWLGRKDSCTSASTAGLPPRAGAPGPGWVPPAQGEFQVTSGQRFRPHMLRLRSPVRVLGEFQPERWRTRRTG